MSRDSPTPDRREAVLRLLDVFGRRADLQQAFPEVWSRDYGRLLEWAAGVVERKWEDSDYETLKSFGDRYRHLASLWREQIRDLAVNEWRLDHRFYQRYWSEKVEKDYERFGYYYAVGSTSPQNYLETGRMMFDGIRLCGIKETDTVLDYGCGNGRLALHLQGFLKGQYYGVDISERLVQDARNRVTTPNFTFMVSNGPSVDFPDHYFDFVCAFSVITHLDIDYTKECFREWRRVSKPRSNLCISFISNENITSSTGNVEHMEHNPKFLKEVASEADLQFVAFRDVNIGQLLLHLTVSEGNS